MAARRRIASRRNWPANLRVNSQGYYSYQQPGTGKSFGLGKDFKIACDEVRTVNAELERAKGHVSLLHRVTGMEVTLAAWCDTYATENAGANHYTAVGMKSQIKAIKGAKFSVQNIGDVKPKEIAQFIRECIDTRGPNMANTIRSRLMDLFRSAIEHGVIDAGKNPVESILKPTVVVNRSRLTLDDFKLILAEARTEKHRPWIANALELALVCGQRREDIAAMRFDQVKDGFLWISQSKGKEGHQSQLKIPLALRLDAIGKSLEEVLRGCRDNVVSKSVLHFTVRNSRALQGDPVGTQTLSNTFAEMRDRVIMAKKMKVADGKTPPSFHEIRSLAARLYTEQYGKEFAQALLGHKSAAMTDLYRDVRGREWTEIKLAGA